MKNKVKKLNSGELIPSPQYMNYTFIPYPVDPLSLLLDELALIAAVYKKNRDEKLSVKLLSKAFFDTAQDVVKYGNLDKIIIKNKIKK